MKHIVLFICTYILVFLLYYLFLVKKGNPNEEKKGKKKKKDNKKPMEVILLESRYSIDIKKINYDRLLLVIAAVSAFDITIIVTLMGLFRNYIIQLLVLIGILPLILISYSFIGKTYENKEKKGKKKND